MGEGGSYGVWDGYVHSAVFKMDFQQGPTVQHRELSMLCGSMDGRGVLGRMNTCMCMAESHCCSEIPETISILLISYQSVSSAAQSCLTLCDPMNCSMPGLPVHHQLPEFTHTHVHQVGDAIQPSHPLSSPFPRAPNPSQHQGLLQ